MRHPPLLVFYRFCRWVFIQEHPSVGAGRRKKRNCIFMFDYMIDYPLFICLQTDRAYP